MTRGGGKCPDLSNGRKIERGKKTGDQEAGRKSAELYSFSKYLLNIYCVSGIALGAENTVSEQKRQNLNLNEVVVCGVCQIIGCA